MSTLGHIIAITLYSGGGAAGLGLEFFAPLTSSLTLAVGDYPHTFTRATTATFVDHEGLIKTSALGEPRFRNTRHVHNRVNTTSEDFADAAWTKSLGILTNNIADPFGGTAAFRFEATSSNALLYQGAYADFVGKTVANSYWLRQVNILSNIRIYTGSSSSSLNTGLLPADNDWHRITPGTALSTSDGRCGIRLLSAGDIIEVAFFQAEDASSPTFEPGEYVSIGVLSAPEYHGLNIDGVKDFETTNGNTVDGITITEAPGVPLSGPFKYKNEPAATNNAWHSSDFSDAVWVASNITKSSDGIDLPDGATGAAETLTASAANGTLLQTITLASAANVFSVYLQRKTGSGNVDITLDNGATWTTKALTGAGTWDRVEFAGVAAANPIAGVRIVTSGDAIQMWAAQLETGTVATSYIATEGSTVTRNADILSYDYQPPALLGSMSLAYSLSGTPGSTVNGLTSNATSDWLNHASSLTPRWSSGTAGAWGTDAVVDTESKIGLTWEDGAGTEVQAYRGGSTDGTSALDANGFVAGTDELGIGSNGATGAAQMNGLFSEIKFFSKALTQTQMEDLTN